MINIEKLASQTLEKGIKENVHDLYFLPYNKGYYIIFRRGDKFLQKQTIPQDIGKRLIVHFKFNGGMNVGEKRRAQLGAMNAKIFNKNHRLRLSTAGDYQNRESLVIRYLYQNNSNAPLKFFHPEELDKAREVSYRRGLHLFCGPVGSGKTTLMYELCKARKKEQQIIAIEDPVEIIDENILQFQINEVIGMDYDTLIKLCLRHRPDILIVGEIRDEKTAKAVIRAALTGHTVFSTIHAGSVQGIFRRLLDLKVSEVDLKESLSGIYFQRLLINLEKEASVLLDVATEQDNWRGGWNLKIQNLCEKGVLTDEYCNELLEKKYS